MAGGTETAPVVTPPQEVSRGKAAAQNSRLKDSSVCRASFGWGERETQVPPERPGVTLVRTHSYSVQLSRCPLCPDPT